MASICNKLDRESDWKLGRDFFCMTAQMAFQIVKLKLNTNIQVRNFISLERLFQISLESVLDWFCVQMESQNGYTSDPELIENEVHMEVYFYLDFDGSKMICLADMYILQSSKTFENRCMFDVLYD